MVRASFSGLEIGKSALTLSQLGLDVTGHNIANVDTKGYTRQRIINTAYDPFSVIGRALPVDQARIGGGVKVLIHDQIRSAYLDSRFRVQNTLNAYWQKRTENLTYLESYFDNVNENTSINYSISRFFEAVKVLAEDTVEKAPRKLLQTAGLDLVKQINTIYAGLIDLQESQNLAVKITVEEINRIAKDIVELNKAIYGFEVTGSIALDLRDKRNVLLDDLSSIIPIEYREYSDGRGNSMLEVRIGGQVLVDHDNQYLLTVREVPNAISGETDVWEAIWEPRKVPVPGAESELTLYMGSDKVTLPISFGAISVDPADLDAVASLAGRLNALASQFNRLHVFYDDVAEEIVPVVTDPADPGYKKAVADCTSANKILAELQSLLGNDMVVSFECEPGGKHAIINIEIETDDGAGNMTTDTYIFARSAVCIDAKEPTYRVGFTIPEMEDGPVTVLLVEGGELKAYLDMRDSEDVHTPGIPYYVNMLNDLSRALVQEINAVHRAGWTEDVDRPEFLGLPNGSIQGVNFFSIAGYDAIFDNIFDGTAPGTGIVGIINNILANPPSTGKVDPSDPAYKDYYELILNDPAVNENAGVAKTIIDVINDLLSEDPPVSAIDPGDPADQYYGSIRDMMYNQVLAATVTAKNIALSDAVMDSEYNIACSSEMIEKNRPDGLQRGNNENMNLMYELFLKKNIALPDGTDIGSFDGFATGIRFDVANTLSFAKKTADNFNVLTIAADNQRLAVSGVSLDEEMTNLVKYQHAYNGAARVITAMDEALDVLINRTGRVGL